MTRAHCRAWFDWRLLLIVPVILCGPARGQQAQKPVLVQPTLIAPGSPPFHLMATITDKDDPDSKTEVELYWAAPDKWRRTIKSDDFSQTLIVNGTQVQDDHEGNYFPLALETLTTAMIDPESILESLRPGDQIHTKANGDSLESGMVCFGPRKNICMRGRDGLMEMVGAPGHPVDFTSYENFGERRVARLLLTSPERGTTLVARVNKLEPLPRLDAEVFQITKATPAESQLKVAVLSEAELKGLAAGNPEIIWPQVLDGEMKGTASLYLSVDREGKVRETLPLFGGNERAMDSLRRQVTKWQFKPAMKNGVPVQAEGIMNFDFNLRSYGPADPLSDTEARKLASNIVDPAISKGKFPEGTTCTLHVSIDHEGSLIEMIQGPGPNELCMASYAALKQWKFNPVMENGQGRPFRADLVFVAK